jgi:glycosyltransferase involved in cell wall biosynthesis
MARSGPLCPGTSGAQAWALSEESPLSALCGAGFWTGWESWGRLRRAQDLGFAPMLEFYDRSRIVPNESIFGEVNFRLFEAASCGCAVINPATPGLQDLFIPGEEVAAYRDGAELADWVNRLLP